MKTLMMIIRIILVGCLFTLCIGTGPFGSTPIGIPPGTTRADGSAHQNNDTLIWLDALQRWASAAGGTGTGDVTGPSGATAGHFPVLDSTGKILSDSGYNPASFKTLTSAALPSGSTPSLASYDAYTDSQTSDLTSPAIVSAVGTKRIIFFTATRAVRFDTSTTLKGNGSVSWTTANGAWMELNSDGTYWRCAIHGAD